MTKPTVPQKIADARSRLLATLAPVVGDGAIDRLDEALTHPSFANESGARDNQRLEFLGDAVLGLCVTEALEVENPDASEGELTRVRAALVNAEALAVWGREVGLGECLSMGRGARAGTESDQTNVLADAVEALIAAVYLARGLPGARALTTAVTSQARAEGSRLASLDPKSALQEKVQARGAASPRYQVVASSGPAHEPLFEVEVIVGDTVLARGSGRSKRLAERAAAEAALLLEAASGVDVL